MNLDNDDSIYNLVPKLQRYDDGDAPEVQSTQPVELFPLQKKCIEKSSETCTKDHPKFILKKATLCYGQLLHTALFLYHSLMDTVELLVLQKKMTQ